MRVERNEIHIPPPLKSLFFSFYSDPSSLPNSPFMPFQRLSFAQLHNYIFSHLPINHKKGRVALLILLLSPIDDSLHRDSYYVFVGAAISLQMGFELRVPLF